MDDKLQKMLNIPPLDSPDSMRLRLQGIIDNFTIFTETARDQSDGPVEAELMTWAECFDQIARPIYQEVLKSIPLRMISQRPIADDALSVVESDLQTARQAIAEHKDYIQHGPKSRPEIVKDDPNTELFTALRDEVSSWIKRLKKEP